MKWIKLTDRLPQEGKQVVIKDSQGIMAQYTRNNDGYNESATGNNNQLVEWLDEEAEWVDPQLERILKTHQEIIHTYHCGSLADKIGSVLRHYQRESASAIGERKRMTEDTLVYFRSVVMITESIGLAGTHGEKNARLRGLIELLNTAIDKLRDEQLNGLLHNWPDYSIGGRSDYPYRSILDEVRNLKRENDELKKQLNGSEGTTQGTDDDNVKF
ncbi:hypothetical protein GCM10027592_29130 [Spirosoma flavus]